MIAAIEEERFTRVKHWAGFPRLAIEFCLKEAGIGFEKVDYFAIGRDPSAKFFRKLLFLARNAKGSATVVRDRLMNSKKISGLDETLSTISGLPVGNFKNKIVNVEHHRSHIASAFFASPFEKAACLSIDGSGDFSTTMIGIGYGNNFEVLEYTKNAIFKTVLIFR